MEGEGEGIGLTNSSRVTIFTDGACKGNPGRGGWAAVLIRNGVQQVICGGEPRTTNNRMELMAAIKGLEAAAIATHPVQEFVLYTDSQYLVNTMTKGWKRNANLDLWERLDRLVKTRQVTWKWVRGHNGTPGNELADTIASREAGLVGSDPSAPAAPSSGEAPKAARAKPSSRSLRRPRRSRL